MGVQNMMLNRRYLTFEESFVPLQTLELLDGHSYEEFVI